MEFFGPEYWSRQLFPSAGDLPNPEIEPRSPAVRADSLPAEPQGKPKNTEVGSLSLLQWIFLTQESNRLAGGFFTNWAIRRTLKVKVKVAQSFPTLCNPVDYTVHGILQARKLEWVAIPFCRGCSQPRDRTQVSHTAGRFFTSWTTREAWEYWSG